VYTANRNKWQWFFSF